MSNILMLIFAFLAIVVFDNVHLTYAEKTFILNDFGFKAGGTFNMTVSNSISELIFGLLSEEQAKQFLKIDVKDDQICENLPAFSKYETKLAYSAETGGVAGTIEEDGIYSIFFYNCNDKQNVDFMFSANFANPESNLDTRIMPCLIEQPIFLCIFFILLCYWFINWIRHFNVRIYIHYFMTAIFIVALVRRAFKYASLMYTVKHEQSQALYGTYTVLKIVGYCMILVTILLISKGWCIIRSKVHFEELALSLIYSIIYVCLLTLMVNESFGSWDVIFVLLMITALGLYFKELLTSLNIASIHLLAHLLSISKAGIDPESTPIYQRYRKYIYLKTTFAIYFFMVGVEVVTVFFADNIFWMESFMNDISDAFLLISFAVIFRLRPQDDFVEIDNNDEASYSIDDIENLTLASSEFTKSGKKWERGMKLPPPPEIVPPKDVVTLESPDGAFEMRVHRVNSAENLRSLANNGFHDDGLITRVYPNKVNTRSRAQTSYSIPKIPTKNVDQDVKKEEEEEKDSSSSQSDEQPEEVQP